MNKKYIALAVAVLVGVSFASSAHAAEVGVTGKIGVNIGQNNGRGNGAMMRGGEGRMQKVPGVIGKVTAVSGTTLTVKGRSFVASSTEASYTIDASTAIVKKNNATTTLSSVVVGDTVLAQGAITGTSVKATAIYDGKFMGSMRMGDKSDANGDDKDKAAFPDGNGQPVIGGTVSAVAGNTITITNKSNVTYTIDVTNAKITQKGTAETVSDVKIGSSVLAQGTVNGTSVTAVTVIDQGVAPVKDTNGKPQGGGFFGGIKSFFARLFGF